MDCKKCKSPLPEGANFCPVCGKPAAPVRRRKRKRAHGSGSIKKLPGNRQKPWAAYMNDIYIGSYKTYADADAALAKLTAEDRKPGDTYNLTFAQVYERWFPAKERTVSKSQAGCYQTAYRACPQFHDRRFRSITRSEYQQAVMELEAQGKSKSSCEKLLQLFGQLNDWAVAEGIIASSHSAGVNTVAQQKSERRPFSRDDLRRIQAAKHPAAKIAMVLCATGCRPGELFAAKLSDCHDAYFIGGSKTQAGRNRIIAVASFGMDAYKSLLSSAKANGGTTLADGYQGNKVVRNFGKRDWKELMQEIGKPSYTPYNCRHTFATMMVEAGLQKKAIQLQLGHATTEVQNIYEHPEESYLLSQIAKLTL